MIMKTTWTFLLGFLQLATPTARAQLIFTTNSGSITITGFYGTPVVLTIPGTTNGLPVTGIEAEAFFNCSSLASITLGTNVTSIGEYAFYGCGGLASATILGNGASIGEDAFDFCSSLASLTISNGVVSIGEEAFSGCSRLTSVTIPSSVTNIGLAAFQDCSILTAITVAAQNAFYSSSNGVLFDKHQTALLEYPAGLSGSYTISGGVTSIGEQAFGTCASLTGITIPASVTNIGTLVFANCSSLPAITVAANNSFYNSTNGVLFDKSQTTLLDYPGGKSGSYAIPGTVTSIGEYAFWLCYGLTGVTIPPSVTSLGDEAFAFCSSLTKITIPASVTNIADYAFDDCRDLTSVYFTGNAPAADSTLFYRDNDSVLTTYYLPGTTGWSNSIWGYPAAGPPAVLWNPLIQASGANFGVRNNQFVFNIAGTTNIPILVEACTNLANPVWTPLQTLTLTNGSVHFSDAQWTNYPGRYYRISSP
jgi:hypothetical protein